MSSETANMAIKRNGYKDIMTSHGFRALISTHLNAQGYNEDILQKAGSVSERCELWEGILQAQKKRPKSLFLFREGINPTTVDNC